MASRTIEDLHKKVRRNFEVQADQEIKLYVMDGSVVEDQLGNGGLLPSNPKLKLDFFTGDGEIQIKVIVENKTVTVA